MSYSIKVIARTRENARLGIVGAMAEQAKHFPDSAKASHAILALFDSQPDYNSMGYIVEAHGGANSIETMVRITRLIETSPAYDAAPAAPAKAGR